jgi:hypothetical protein
LVWTLLGTLILALAAILFRLEGGRAAEPQVEQASGLTRALAVVLALSLVIGALTVVFAKYYRLDSIARLASPLHDLLRPTGAIGLACGVGAVLLIFANLAYLARRARWFRDWIPGSLRGWMTSHVATGICAFLLVLVHSAMDPRNTVGGHAFVALAILVVTGAIGRYFYSFVPRAADGRELVLDEVKALLASLSGEWDRQSPAFAERARAEIQELTVEASWRSSFARRLVGLVTSHRRLRASLERLRVESAQAGISPDQIGSLLSLAGRAQRASLMAAHFEDLRALLATWRYLHRWVALAMVLLTAVHVVTAWRFGGLRGRFP